MKTRILIVLAVLLTAVAALGLSNPLSGVRAFTETCLTTATAIDDGKAMAAALVFNNSATPAFIGGADVNATTEGFPICTDAATCPTSYISIDARGLKCMSAGGAVTVKVLAGAM